MYNETTVIPLHTHWDGYNKKMTVTSIEEDTDRLELLYIAGENI